MANEVTLEDFVADLLANPVVKEALANPTPDIRIPMELADALVVFATRVTCNCCETEHVATSRIMRRVPKANGIHYKPVLAGVVGEEMLPHLVEWTEPETLATCWRCFDLTEWLIKPDMLKLAAPLVPDVIFDPKLDDMGGQRVG